MADRTCFTESTKRLKTFIYINNRGSLSQQTIQGRVILCYNFIHYSVHIPYYCGFLSLKFLRQLYRGETVICFQKQLPIETYLKESHIIFYEKRKFFQNIHALIIDIVIHKLMVNWFSRADLYQVNGYLTFVRNNHLQIYSHEIFSMICNCLQIYHIQQRYIGHIVPSVVRDKTHH